MVFPEMSDCHEPVSVGLVRDSAFFRPATLFTRGPLLGSMAELLVVGDRVLIEPQTGEEKTEAGLVLPASVSHQEDVMGGHVVKTGPGYLTQNPEYSETETWKQSETPVRYLPLQAEPGDYAFFLRNEAIDLRYEETEYMIVHHNAILALVRGNDTPEDPSDTTLEDIDDLDDLWDDDD